MEGIKISAVIITYNEEDHIGTCIDSLNGLVEEIIVVDSYSTDNTKNVCLTKGVKFVEHKFEGHIQQKNHAINVAEFDHVFSIDADEFLSKELKQSISEIKKDWNADGYRLKRLSSYNGHWIRHSGWYPDSRVRIWDRRKGKWGGENPHDIVIMDKNAKVKWLEGNLMHNAFSSFNSFLQRQLRYAEISANEAFKKNVKFGILDIIFRPLFTFVTRYFYKLGILDGYRGFVICFVYGIVKFVKCSRVRELQKESKKKKPAS